MVWAEECDLTILFDFSKQFSQIKLIFKLKFKHKDFLLKMSPLYWCIGGAGGGGGRGADAEGDITLC